MKHLNMIARVLAVSLAGVLLLSLAYSAPVGADAKAEVCSGIGQVSSDENCSTGGRSTVNSIIRTIINILSFIVGIAAVIMIIVAGLKYIMSGGESAQTASAKNTLLFAIVGLVVAVMAQFIARFVLGKALGIK